MHQLFKRAVYPIVNVDDHSDPLAYIKKLLVGAPPLLQLRAKKTSDRDLLDLSRKSLLLCKSSDCKLIINDRPDICLLAGADGVHLGQDDLAPEAVRKLIGTGIIGYSTHDLNQLKQAPDGFLDYLALGPIFFSSTKHGHAPEVGLDILKQAAQSVRLPLVAIGGINLGNAESVFRCGVKAVAVVADLQRAEKPADVMESYQQIFSRTSG